VEAENVVDLAMSYADAGRPLDSAALVLDGFARYRRAGASLQVRDMFILSFRALVQLGGDEAACIVAAHMARGVTDVWREYFTPRRLVTVVEDRLGPARTTRLQVMARHQRTRDAIDQVERVLTDLHATARS
jgi:hypothetical protein